MNQPPIIAQKFLSLFLKEDLLEEVMGDLEEYYLHQYHLHPRWKCNLMYWKQVLHYIRPFAIKNSHSKHHNMTTHNIKIALRNFKKFKTSFITNIIGLTAGLVSVMLIAMWIGDELQKDNFHEHSTTLYRVINHQVHENEVQTMYETPIHMAEALKTSFPEIELAVGGTDPKWFGAFMLKDSALHQKATGHFASEDFFKMFSYPLIAGTPQSVLKDPNSIVLSESLASSLFGSTEAALGKSLEWQLLHLEQPVVVSGVFQDLPSNATDQFDFVLHFKAYTEIIGEGAHWNNYNAFTYIKTQPNSNTTTLNKKLKGFLESKAPGSNCLLEIVPFANKYLYENYEAGIQSGGRIVYIRILGSVAIVLLIIACINFMNLSTARAMRRKKEVAVRKTIGARRSGLIYQYIVESTMVVFFSMLLAWLIVLLLLPSFNVLTGKTLAFHFNWTSFSAMLLGILATGLVAGSYPALYLSNFKPSEALKSNHIGWKAIWARKGLVIFQFCLSVLLIIAVIVVHQQLDYIQNKNLGYNREQIVVLPKEGNATKNTDQFVEQLKALPGVVDATTSHHRLVDGGPNTTGVTWPGKDPDTMIRFSNVTVSKNFIATMGIRLLEGRTFSADSSLANHELIINQTALKTMGLVDPVGSTINLWGKDCTVVGVIEDFHAETLHTKVAPMVVRHALEDTQYFMVKVAPENYGGTLSNIKLFMQQHNPEFPFEYEWMDQQFNAQYQSESRVALLSSYFAGLAILISCLGLFGLASFTAEQKTKEIAIRKVLGANRASLVWLLSNGFSKTVLVSILQAIPLGYWLLEGWLQQFAYRIELQLYHFILSGIAAMAIAIVTVASQTFTAANSNPTAHLKGE